MRTTLNLDDALIEEAGRLTAATHDEVMALVAERVDADAREQITEPGGRTR